jgi:hypothetical protein
MNPAWYHSHEKWRHLYIVIRAARDDDPAEIISTLASVKADGWTPLNGNGKNRKSKMAKERMAK